MEGDISSGGAALTAEVMARWQGATEQKLIDHSGHLLSLDERAEQNARNIGETKKEIGDARAESAAQVATLKTTTQSEVGSLKVELTKVAASVRAWSAIGAIVGAGLIQAILHFIPSH